MPSRGSKHVVDTNIGRMKYITACTQTILGEIRVNGNRVILPQRPALVVSDTTNIVVDSPLISYVIPSPHVNFKCSLCAKCAVSTRFIKTNLMAPWMPVCEDHM